MKKRKASEKEPMWVKIGDELTDEIAATGLSFLLLIFGSHYFHMKFAFFEVIDRIVEEAGMKTPQYIAETQSVKDAILSLFPLNIMFGHNQDPTMAVLIGFALLFLGIVVKIITTGSKGDFVRAMGKILMVPGAVGIIAMIIIQAVTAISVMDLIRKGVETGAYNELIGTKGLSLWNQMGGVFIVGFYTLMIGVILGFIIHSNDNKPFEAYIVTRGLRYMGAFCVIYYSIMRLFASKLFTLTEIGQLLRVFALSGYLSAEAIIASITIFTTGYIVWQYGKYMMRKERKKAWQRYYQRQTYQQAGY
ncbi:hypothetical protein GF351_00690 [Candidatus Woesearchaeota archaeon]|nr:hypothetical protein [Candidatus Woesearchaeota archaeon]